jgi:hypothetical protein
MAATFFWGEDNGTAAGSPPAGTTRTTGVNQVNWKNTDDVATAYSSSPINAGSNSYEKYQFAIWTGSYNEISSVKFQHVSGVLDSSLGIHSLVSGFNAYATPATSTNAALVRNLTSTGLISTGLAVLVGTVGPEQSGKAASSAGTPAVYSEYLITQLRTTASTPPGDTATVTFQLQYSEN